MTRCEKSDLDVTMCSHCRKPPIMEPVQPAASRPHESVRRPRPAAYWVRGSDCECDISCCGHASGGRCVLNGRPHVHPGDGRGNYGPCPVHPQAARSPLFNLIGAARGAS
jgi:hypothetical protein